jgi:hypothetical protein
MTVRGSCHCGGVRIEVSDAPTEVTHCNCSVCRRIGGLWAYYRPDEVRMEGETVRYIWGDRTLARHHCPTCGVTMAWTPLLEGLERMGVNARVLDGIDAEALPVREFDGAAM